VNIKQINESHRRINILLFVFLFQILFFSLARSLRHLRHHRLADFCFPQSDATLTAKNIDLMRTSSREKKTEGGGGAALLMSSEKTINYYRRSSMKTFSIVQSRSAKCLYEGEF
jgi:hypothetical protein